MKGAVHAGPALLAQRRDGRSHRCLDVRFGAARRHGHGNGGHIRSLLLAFVGGCICSPPPRTLLANCLLAGSPGPFFGQEMCPGVRESLGRKGARALRAEPFRHVWQGGRSLHPGRWRAVLAASCSAPCILSGRRHKSSRFKASWTGQRLSRPRFCSP